MSDEDEKQRLIHLLSGKVVRVTLSDNRMVQGKLECLDRDKNVILGEAVQCDSTLLNAYMGFIMLPGPQITKVELVKKD